MPILDNYGLNKNLRCQNFKQTVVFATTYGIINKSSLTTEG